MSNASKADKVMDEEESEFNSQFAKSSASMTYEGQATAAKEQSMSESQSRAFRADSSHQDPQFSRSSQNAPYLRFDPAQKLTIDRDSANTDLYGDGPLRKVQRHVSCQGRDTQSHQS